MEWKGEKSLLLSTLARQKQKLVHVWMDQIKENFKNEMLFMSFTATGIITTRNGWDGKNFDIGNRWLAALKCRTVQVCQHQIAQHSDNSTFRSFWDIIKSSCNLFYVELSYLFSCQDRETNSEEDEDDANNDTIGPLLPTPKVI